MASIRISADDVTDRVPRASPGDRVEAVRTALPGHAFLAADAVAVLDGERFVGLVPIERLLAADAAERVEAIMDPDPPIVDPRTRQEAAVWEMIARAESSLAVTADDGRFAGLVPSRRLLAVLLAEHDEDLARIGGYLASSSRARQAAEEPLGRRLWHRLPWLVVGLLGAMASALVVGAFEEELSANVLLAFFVPAVVYMADAVGTQTETVLIRGMSAGVRVRDVARRELLTGTVLGVLVAAGFLAFALVAWGEADMALAVALALLASCSVATVVAMALPALFARLGRDPAFGSGPLATVVQDLLSIAIYFAIAVPLAG